MKKLAILFVFLFALFAAIMLPNKAFAANTAIDFIFSRNVVEFQRDKNGKNIVQVPTITISGVAEPEKVTGFTASYIRTHGGDGARLKRDDAKTTQPNLAGSYTIVMSFENTAPFVFKSGEKVQEYPAALIIKRAAQTAPILRSATPTLKDDETRTGGTILVGEQAVVSVAWASGVKPILTWTAGSDVVVTPEDGKPARFTAKAGGNAVLTALLPEDNNHTASPTALYTVTVTGSATASSFYDLSGATKNRSGWYTSDVSIIGKNGFTRVVSQGAHPISTDGTTTLAFALENDSGGQTEQFSVTVKKDSTAPTIDNVRVNDNPWQETPENDKTAWAADADLIFTADIFDTSSGLAKVEYRIDGGNYISDENTSFSKEGYASHEFTYALDNTGHVLWLRATDTAGNATVKEYLLPAGDGTQTPQGTALNVTASNSTSESNSQSTVPQEPEITTPTDAMNDVLKDLNYYNRSNIEARVIGDVRANSKSIAATLDKFKALSQNERKALGEETLAALRAFFEMLYTVQGGDAAELEPLFVFTAPVESESQSIAAPQSESASAPQSESVSMPQSESASMPKSESSSAIVSVAQRGGNGFSILYLVPIIAIFAAIFAYFAWRKKLSSKDEEEFEIPSTEEINNAEFLKFKDFDDKG